MSKFIGATRIAIIKGMKKKDEAHSGRKGMLKTISKKFKSPTQAI